MKAIHSTRRSHTKAPSRPPRRDREGFTLIELLVVVAIAAILMGIGAAAFKPPGLRQASADQMTQALDEARMTAVETGTRVYIGFADASYPDESKRLRGYVLFRELRPDEIATQTTANGGAPPSASTFVALTPWAMLPRGFYIDNQPTSSLFQQNSPSGGARLSDPQGLNTPPGVSVTLYVIVFDSLGEVVQPQGNNPCLTVVAGKYTAAVGFVPTAPRDSSAYLASAFSVEVSRLTGRVQYQDGLPPLQLNLSIR